MDAQIAGAVERLLREHCGKATLDAAEAGEFPAAMWRAFEAAGLHLLGHPDSGTGLEDLFGAVGLAGRHAAPLPLAETLLANRLAVEETVCGLATIAVRGVAPWGRSAERVLHLETGAAVVAFGVEEHVNVAGEPRDRVLGGEPAGVVDASGLHELLALARAVMMAGAMARVLELAVAYATERVQFGRPVARFQAIQHNLAVLAAEAAAAQRAVDGAIEALGAEGFRHQVAAAKARAGEAAGVVAEIGHQVHGAMGFTHEHTLHHFTRRLWAWRDEYGAESEWQERLGGEIASAGADGVWAFVTNAERGAGGP